ncbi:MAG: hypothetical protein AB7S26_33970 [Sandaracinaceae bacterium]
MHGWLGVRFHTFGWLLLFATACDGTISVTFATGAQTFAVSADSLAIPPEVADGATIRSVPCNPSGLCPSSAEVAFSCEADVCNPAPKTLSVVGPEVDVGALLADTREVGLRVVDAYEVLDVTYDVQTNTLTVPTDPVEVFWGPSGANAVDTSLGVRHFGTMPAIEAGQLGTGHVALDASGVAEMSDYLVGTAQQVRFFAQTTVDLEPGDPIPAGNLQVSVNATIRAVGSILE